MSDKSEENKTCLNTVEEAKEMIGPNFLKWVSEFAKRLKERSHKDRDIQLYHLVLIMQFPPSEEELTFDKIQNSTNIQLFALTQEEIDNLKVKSDSLNVPNPEEKTS